MKKQKSMNNPETEPLLSVLRAAIEATADGLLVTDKQGRVLCYNQFYVNMWPIPNEFMGHARHEPIIQHCFGQLRDPDQFLRMTREIYAMWPPESFDVLQFNDG